MTWEIMDLRDQLLLLSLKFETSEDFYLAQDDFINAERLHVALDHINSALEALG